VLEEGSKATKQKIENLFMSSKKSMDNKRFKILRLEKNIPTYGKSQRNNRQRKEDCLMKVLQMKKCENQK